MVKSFDEQPGIKSVVAGYTGGTTVNPTYEQVASLTTGHTEAVKITFDPNVISYAQLVEIYWHQTDPTDVAGQFQYREDSYRPVIFVNGPEQRQVAESSRDSLTASSCFNDPIVTQIENVKPFYPAEAVHQDFYWQNPFRFQIEEMGGRAQFIKQRWQCDRN